MQDVPERASRAILTVAVVALSGCGPPLPDTRLIGGVPTVADEVVRLEMCGGTLIAPDVVLTAAHCPRAGNAIVGRPNLGVRTDGAEIPVLSRHDHPDAERTPRSGNPDLRVLRLAQPAIVGGAELPFARIGPRTGPPPSPVTAMGWGSSSGSLRSATLTTLACGGGGVTFCTADGRITEGDSGGPIFASTTGPKTITGTISAREPAGGSRPTVRDVHVDLAAATIQQFVPGPHGSLAPGRWTALGSPCVEGTAAAGGYDFPSSYRTWQAADVNGDGRDDLVARDISGGVDTFLGLGDGRFRAPSGATDNQPGWGREYEPAGAYLTMQSGDFNGDGRADLLIRHPEDGIEIAISEIAPDGTGSWQPWGGDAVEWNLSASPKDYSDVAGWGDPQRYETILTGDVDGDGLSDIVSRNQLGIIVHRNDGSGGWEVTEQDPQLTAAFYDQPRYYGTFLLADVARDIRGFEGSDELVHRTPCGIRVWQRSPSGTWVSVREPDCSDPQEWNDDAFSDPSHWSTIQAANIDGNGCLDLIARGTETLRVLLSACDATPGTDLFTEVSPGTVRMPDRIALDPPFPGWEQPEYYSTIRAADLDGDGYDDVLSRGPSGIETWIGDGTGHFRPADPHRPFWGDHFPVMRSAAFPGDTWAAERFYRTLLLADLDGAASPRVQLVGRQQCGAEVWDFR